MSLEQFNWYFCRGEQEIKELKNQKKNIAYKMYIHRIARKTLGPPSQMLWNLAYKVQSPT